MADDPQPRPKQESGALEPANWFNRNIAGMGLASLLSDLGHEAATALLPLFLMTLGASPMALGLIEGVSDGASTVAKVAAGRVADRVGLRLKLASLGYLLTGFATGSFAAASSWVQLLAARTVGWVGRGGRSPCRNTLLVDSVPTDQLGRAFGFERAMDTVGAILGPLAATLLVGSLGMRKLFLLSLFPGLAAGVAFYWVVREPNAGQHREAPPFPGWGVALPPVFRRFLTAVAIFGAGDFAHSMLVMRAAGLLGSSAKAMSLALLLYVLHNVAHALFSYPIGALGDRVQRRKLLALWYFVAAIAAVGFAWGPTRLAPLAVLFILAGTVMAAQETLESAVAAEVLPAGARGPGFGVLAAANGIGDLVSSALVGLLWTRFSPDLAFGYSAALSFLAAALLALAL